MESNQQQQNKAIVKFKSTTTSHDLLQLDYQDDKTVQEYRQQIASIFDDEAYNVKLVFKGKVLKDKQKAAQLGLKNSTVMMVLTKTKKVDKPKLTSAEQTIPTNSLATGLGSSSPIGFGGYQIMNHPQYMSAISNAVNQQKMQQMMDDPFYQQMMEQMLDDPQTLKHIMQQNPMTKQLIEGNPMMKMIMSNPAMMKMVFNKDTIKMAKQMQKKGNSNQANSPIANSNPFTGFPGMNLNSFQGLGPNLNPTNTSNNSSVNASNPMGNPFGYPFSPMGMMGSGFNANQSGNNFNNQGFNPFLSNPLFMGVNPNLTANQSNNSGSNPSSIQQGGLFSLLQNLKKVQQQASDEVKYQNQIKELNSMGISDKGKCLKYLKQCNGDIDRALQKMFLDEDEKESNQNK